ncbi:aromatase/cyclase [Streptomyces sp. 184]|uniref:aromatase/cyclase n=1 Tax=Streptomyces sp. 184 TaxID=1827526 RepID=UPI0038924D4D
MVHTHHVRHTTTVAAPPTVAYGLLADAPGWPRLFPSVVHVEQAPAGPGEDTLRLWTTAHGRVANGGVRRRLDPDALTVGFRHIAPHSPVAVKGGTWRIRPAGDGGCEVVLDQAYAAVDDDPEQLAWIRAAAEADAKTDLENLKQAAEQADRIGEVLVTFTDELEIAAGPAKVHEFLWRAEAWRELPHVVRVELTDISPRTQILEMETRIPDGSRHTTESVRVSLGPKRIVYKHIRRPALIAAHTAEWELTETPDGVRAVNRQTIVLQPAAVADFLGPGAPLAEARAFVRRVLGTINQAAMRYTKAVVEQED